jgi:hypothetical protein
MAGGEVTQWESASGPGGGAMAASLVGHWMGSAQEERRLGWLKKRDKKGKEEMGWADLRERIVKEIFFLILATELDLIQMISKDFEIQSKV